MDLDVRRWDTGPSVSQRAGSFVRALSSGPTVGRPRSGGSGLVLNCAVAGVLLSVVGALIAGVLSLVGAL
ncbi:hypothetical protein [Baekduia alba]|uniref:hypothetical protein n=1 Tax=Baekduia alba TaxID=2997333 RepID=UPI0023401FF9|nr:hypothetical protein [Baekduia alba]